MAGEANDNAQFQDALSQLFGRLQDPNQAPSPTMQPGYPGGPPNPANLPINARSPQVPYQNASQPLPPMPPATAPAARPTPSDDPAVTMPTLPTVPSFRAPTQLNNRIATRTAIDDVNSSHANDARDNRPHWYDRLLGGVTGALVGGVTGNEKQGAAVGGQVTNRAFNRQDQERQRQLSPLFNHLNAEKEDEPFYANADKSDQTSFEDKRQNAVEERNQIATAGRTKALEDRADAYGAKFVAGSEQQDANSPTGWTAETASGDRKPFTPKAGSAKEPKNADEALSAASAALSRGDHAEYDRLTKLAKDIHKQEVDRVREGRPPKEDKNLRGTPNQFRGAEDKKAAALRSAEDEFDKATRDIDLKRQHGTGKTTEDSASDEASYQDDRSRYADQVRVLEQKKAAAQDAYKADIRALGGEAEEGTGPTPPSQAAAPSAKSAPTPEQMSQAEGYLKKAGWNGIGKPNDQQKAKARELANAAGVKF